MKFYKLKKVNTAIIVTVLLSSQAAFAAPVNMQIFDEYESGKAAIAGDYTKAIEIATATLGTKKYTYRKMVEATNLCVAYTKIAKFEMAKEYCEVAKDISLAADRKNNGRKFVDSSGAVISLHDIAVDNFQAFMSVSADKT